MHADDIGTLPLYARPGNLNSRLLWFILADRKEAAVSITLNPNEV